MLLIDSVLFVLILLALFSIHIGRWYHLLENDLIWVIFGTSIIAIPIFV